MPHLLSPTQLAFNARDDGSFNKPFIPQTEFFRDKLNLPTERYDSILNAAHNRSFVVAGAVKSDLLVDFRSAIDQAINDGRSIGWFREQFDNIVQKNGWLDFTGSDTAGGRAWRTRVIYRTNIATSYAAGRYQQLKDPNLLRRRPYWKYIHNDLVVVPRPFHVRWDDLVLHHTNPWWNNHFPPSGYGCRCRVTAVTKRQFKGAKAPDDGFYTRYDKSGIRHTLPNGIDFGWNYAPGASIDTSLRQLVQNKLAGFPDVIAADLSRDINKQLSLSTALGDYIDRALITPIKELFFIGFISNFKAINTGLNTALKGYSAFITSSAARRANSSNNLPRNQRPVVPSDYNKVIEILESPEQVTKLKPRKLSATKFKLIKIIDGERYEVIFEAFGKAQDRSIRLISLVIKTL